MSTQPMSAARLPAPDPFCSDRKVYIVCGGRVWSGVLAQASYDMRPAFNPISEYGFEWWGRLDITYLREDVLPVHKKPSLWKRFLTWYRTQTE